MNKQEKIKRYKKLMEAKKKLLMPLMRKESIISVNKRSVGNSPSRKHTIDTPDKSIIIKNRQKAVKEGDMKYIEPFSFEELHTKLLV